MSSYWWPLGRSAAAAATTNQSPTPSAARSGATAATNTTRDDSSSAAQRPPSSSVDLRHLAQTAFHTSLDNLLVEATKHRSLVVLRDAVLETRQRRYDPISLFDTLCIACSLLAERSGSSGARSFSNASSVAQAAAGEALEGARKALLSSSSNSNTGAPSAANANVNSSGGGAAGGGQGHTSASAGAAALESSFKASTSLSALAPMRATPPLGGATGGGTAAGAAASSTATHSLHYRHRGAARGLLLQSISDVGKLIALGLLPVSLSVGQRVADLVREISFVAPAGAASHRQRQQSPPHASTGTAHAAAAAQERRGAESADGGLHGRAAASRTPPPPLTGPVELVHDDPVLVRLLQLTASAASACQLGSPALPELYGVLLLFYSGVEANSMLEATCEATLTHHIHTVLAALRDNGTSNDGASAASSPLHSDSPAPSTGPSAAPFAAQLQGIAFMKDICRLMVGARTKWLHLSANRSSHRSSSSSGGGGAGGGSGGQTANAATALHREKSTEVAAVTARRANSASSSMAAVTASVVAAAADAERLQQQQQQQQLNHDRSSQVNSLTSTPMTTAIPAANRDTSFSSFGSPLIAASAAGEGGGRRSPPSASLLLAAATTAAAPSSGPATAMACVPERLRVFLMRAVTLFFKEQTTASPPASTTPVPAAARAAQPTASISARSGTDAAALNASPLFVQCLNDCLFSVALWGMYEMDITVPMQPPPSLFVEVMQQQQYTPSHPSLVASSLDLFACTQQLALVTISTNLSLTSNAAQVLMEAHERLLQRLYRKQKMRGAVSSPMHDKGGSSGISGGGGREADAYGERLSQAAIAVLTLWRKTLTSTTLLWDLLQLRATRDGSAPPSAFDAAGTAMGGSLADGIGHAMAAAESSSFLRIDNSRSTSEDSGTREYADTDSDSGAANAAAELDHRVAHDDENEIDALSELESNNNNDRSNTGAVLVNTGDEERPPVPVPPAHLRRRLQPLTLARPQALGAIGSHRLDNTSSREGLHDVGSPRLGMPPLARLVVAVVTLVMAYMQNPPHTPGLPSPSAGVRSSEPLPSGAAAASLLPVTPAPYDAQELSAGSSSLFVSDALAAATTASASDTAHLSSPRRKRSRHVPAMPRCLCATPPTVYQGLTEAVSFVAVFGQHFGQLVETQRRSAQDGNDGNTNSAHVLRRCSSCFVDLHPYLIRCGALCLRYLRYEEDVLPMVLKAVSCWVQVCCAVQLTQQRDAYLSLLLSALRMPDPVVGHLIALAPPTSLMAGTASASAGTAKTAMAALESLVVLNHHYATREPRVPGSVAAAALASDQMGDSSAQSRHHDPSYLAAGRNSSGTRSSMGMAGWGIGWLRRRGRTATAREQAESLTRTRTPHGGASSGTAGGQSGSSSSSTTRARAAAEASRGATPDARSSTVGASQLGHQPTQQQQQQQQSAPMLLISRGWRSPAVQHAVVLGVCRLQHRIMIMKTVHVLANALGAALEDGWALLAHSMALTEPLLHSLKRLLTWIEESSVEQEQQEQLLSDALHLRDALRSLCVNNTCRLPYDQLNCFFSGLVKGTAALGAPPAERSRAAGIAMTGHSWSAGFEGGEATLVAGESVGFNGDDLFHLSAQSSPSMAAYAHLPRHDPQGCADQWVLTSECLCLSMLAVLPFTEQRTAAEMSPVSGGAAGDRGGSSSTTQAVTLQLLQRQRYGALMRALRLWQLETEVCRIALHPRHMERWGTSALISAQAHKRVLLSCTAAARQALRSTGGSGLLSDSPSPEHGEAKPKAPVSSASSPSSASAAAKTKPSGAATASLTEEDVRALEATLTAVVGHVAAVAVHLCRSAARRRRGAEAGGAVAASGAAAAPYQARQSAALVIAAGPFAAVPLVQAANAIFASPAATVAPSPVNLDPSLLPFVQADAALSTAALLYSLQRAVQASSSSASASSSALSGHTLHRTDGVAGSETLAGEAGESSAAAAAAASSAGAGGAVLDPLEHLLASPFALLDDVYAQWSQPVQRVHQAGSAVNDGRVAEGNSTPKHNEGEAEEEEGDVSPLGSNAATSRPSHATAAQQHVESDDDDERNDVAPAAAAGMCCGASTSEVAAAAAAVAAALPQVLASASTAVLMGVVKVVQANGEDIDGAAWESILSLLQRIATQTQAGAGVVPRQEGLLAGAGATTTTTTTSAAGAVTEAARTTSGASNNTGTNAGGGAQTVESLNTAFRALESIQHNHIPRLKVEGLHRLIVCVGAFTVHRVDSGVPGERKLHINLSAVQLLWSTADYLAAFGNASAGGLAGQDRQEGHGSGGVVNSGAYASQGGGEGSLYSNAAEFSSTATRPTATAAQQHQQQQDRLWCSLLWQLRTGCLDDRQEIRQSAMQTFFALVQTYGWRFSGVCWRCVLHGVLQPLIEVVATATRLCATLTPEQEQQQQKSGAAATAGDEAASMVALVEASTSASFIPSLTAAAAAAGSSSSSPYSSPAVLRLLREFMNQPAQLEEARVTLFDAGSRLFVTHHANMQAALQQPGTSPLLGAAAFADGSAAGAVGAARPGSPSPGSSAAAVSPVFRRSPRSFPHGAGGNGGGTGASGGGLDEATAVLEALLQLCGDVCVVVKGTSGEQSAVAAVHALHGLLVEMPGAGLHPHGVHLAWRAMERLLLRGDAVAAAAGGDARAASPSHSAELPYAHTEAKQCTLTVVAAIVAAVCDSFRLQRMVAAAAAAAHASTAMTTAQQPAHSATGGGALGDAQQPLSPGSSISGGFSAYFTGWGSGSSHTSGGTTATAAATHSTPNKSLPGGSRALANSPDGQYGSPAHYFTRLLFLLQAVTRCTAVVNSYYFPSKPQTTLLEGVAAVWPTLTSREARMLWGEVLLPAFPSADELQRFVLQDVVTTATTENSGHTNSSAAAAASPLVPLRAVMPPGSHPGYLSAVMDTMRSLLLLHMGIEGGATTTRSPRAGAANNNSSVLSGGGSDDGLAAFPPHSSAEDRTRLLFMAPSTVQVTGALMLLHLASPAVLAGPPRSGGVPFTVPALFLQECADLLQFALWGPVLSRAPATTAADAEQAALSGTHSPRDKEVGRDGEEGGGSRGALGSQRELWPFATSTATASRDASLPAAAAAARCRRDGVATLCRIFEHLLSAASAVVRHLDTQSRPSNANSVTPGTSPQLTPKPAPATAHLPPSPVSSSVAASSSTVTTTTVPQYVTTALQALDRLVDTLGEVVHLVMEQYEDVASATEAINALSVASTAEGMALARVAKRSLALLQRWADTIGSSNTSGGSGGGGDGSSPQHRGGVTSPTSAVGPHRPPVDSGRPAHSAEPRASRTQLQDVVRASMESRNRAILRQYIDGPDDASAGALLLDTLHDMLRTAQQEQGSGGGAADPLETWDALMPELLEVVACCSPALTRSSTAVAREKDVRGTLSALLSLLHQRHRYRYVQQQQQQNHQKSQGDSLGARGARFLSSVSHRKASASAEDEEAMSII